MASRFNISGKKAVVTGGGSGIGKALAGALSAEGCEVTIIGRRAEVLEAVANEIGATALVGDVANMSDLKRLVSEIGSADILINAAGINLRQPVDEITEDTWDQTIDVNLKAVFFLSRALVAGMKERGWGKIINIASLQSERAFANSVPYGASKGGVMQLTRAMAEAWSKDGITVNALGPGFFPTELTAPVYGNPEKLNELAAQTAMGRNGELEDLVGPTLFFASAASDYVTGQTLYVDGGFTAK
jgi:NAD(P)-dependent dehydrogenase (short-subunit alcohol dehydrogenase family)